MDPTFENQSLAGETSAKQDKIGDENEKVNTFKGGTVVVEEDSPFLGHAHDTENKVRKLSDEVIITDKRRPTVVYENYDFEIYSETEHRWRWVVLAAAISAVFFNTDVHYIAGVLYVAIIDKFGSDPEMTSWLGSMHICFFAFAAPIATAVINATNCRTCVVLSGVVSMLGFLFSSFAPNEYWFFPAFVVIGVGQALANTGSLLAIVYYFPQPAIANGICVGVAGIAIAIFPPVFQMLIDEYGLRGALLLAGAASLHSCISGFLLRPTKFETSRKLQEGTHSNPIQKIMHYFSDALEIVTKPAFTFLILFIFLSTMGAMSMVVLLPKFFIDFIGFSHTEAALAAMLMGVGTVLSRISVGFLSSDTRVGISLTLVGLSGLTGFLSFLGPVILTSHTGGHVFSLLFGLYTGGTYSLVPPLIREILGVEKSASGIGLALFVYGVGGIVGPPIVTKVILTLGHQNVFFFAGSWWVVSAVSMMIVDRFGKSTNNEKTEIDDWT